jgi:sugar porter (SP) family MFS transporter
MKNSKIFLWSLVVALGGFLFGFDTAVISGAERAIQAFWELDDFQHGLTIAIALIGTVFGALFGGFPSDRYGRKYTLLGIAILYFISALGSALTSDWLLFLFYRFIGGLGVGASSVTAPMYISEIAPAKSRGKLVALFQFNVVFGILVAYLSNYLLASVMGSNENDWRWMLGVEALPAFLFLIALLAVPESPRWLIIKRGKVEEARAILQVGNPVEVANGIVSDVLQSHQEAEANPLKDRFFSKRYQTPILLAVVFAVFNQVSGINAIIYYAPRIFEMTGLGKSSALLSSFGIGLVNFVFTLLALNVIDRFGRRTLMLIGSVGLIISLGLVSYSFHELAQEGVIGGFNVPIYLFAFIAFFAFSQGAVIWVFISEIFPNEVRASGQALGSFTHWLLAALIAFTFPYVAKNLGGDVTFLFFTLMMVLQLVFVWKFMPETKGTSLEQIEKRVIS